VPEHDGTSLLAGVLIADNVSVFQQPSEIAFNALHKLWLAANSCSYFFKL